MYNGPFDTLVTLVSSLHDGGGSGGGLWSSELMDLQVDYWLSAGNKKDINKVVFIALLCRLLKTYKSAGF